MFAKCLNGECFKDIEYSGEPPVFCPFCNVNDVLLGCHACFSLFSFPAEHCTDCGVARLTKEDSDIFKREANAMMLQNPDKRMKEEMEKFCFCLVPVSNIFPSSGAFTGLEIRNLGFDKIENFFPASFVKIKKLIHGRHNRS